jgi:hypothetical protein
VPVVALDHSGGQSPNESQWRVVVELHDPFDVMPAFQRIGERSVDRSGGIVDQNVDRANRIHPRVDLVEIGQVGGYGSRVPTARDDPVDHLQQRPFTRATAMTDAPSAASFCAATAPISDDAPVSKIRLPRRSTGLRAGHRGTGRIPARRAAFLNFAITAVTSVRSARMAAPLTM